MNSELLISITDIGDSAVLFGMVVAGCIYLLAAGCRKGVMVLIFAFIFASSLIGILKLLFMGCNGFYKTTMRSPSGHTALSVGVIGAYAMLIASQLKGWRIYIPYLFAVPLVIAIAVSRVMLGAHTVSEVALGLVAGGTTLLTVNWIVKRGEKPKKFNIAALLLTVFLIAAILHGYRLPAENFIQYVAGQIKHYIPVCSKV